MAGVGFWGVVEFTNWRAGLSVASSEVSSAIGNEGFAVIALFLLMGAFASVAGLSADIFRIANAFVGHRRGGLAQATVAGCGGFGAVCGSSVATTATMARIALPEMTKAPLPAPFRGRRGGLGRHFGHPDPALGDHGALCRADRKLATDPVRRRPDPRPDRDRALFRRDRDLRADLAGIGAGRQSSDLGRTRPGGGPVLARHRDHRRRLGRHLFRHLHGDRGGLGRCRPDPDLRGPVRPHDPPDLFRQSPGDRRQHLPDLRHHHRREDLPHLHGLYASAGGVGRLDRDDRAGAVRHHPRSCC